MRNRWTTPSLLAVALVLGCGKQDAAPVKVARDAAPAKVVVEPDDTRPVAIAESCGDEPTCALACTAKLGPACRELGSLRLLDPAAICALGDGEACWEQALIAPKEQRDAALAAAMATLATSCDAGDGHACALGGDLSASGRGGKRDLDLAAERFDRACTLGDSGGCLKLAARQPTRAAVLREHALAISLTECDRGAHYACTFAVTTANDLGAERTARVRRRVALVLDRACEEDAEACHEGTYLEGDRAELERFWQRADRLWTAACDGGDRLACMELARVLSPDGAPHLAAKADPGRARSLWAKACKLGPTPEELVTRQDDPACALAEGRTPDDGRPRKEPTP